MYRRKTNLKNNVCLFGRITIPILVIFLTAVIITAGCIGQTNIELPKTTPAETPSALSTSIIDFSNDVSNLNRVISIDLYNLAEKIGNAGNYNDVEKIALSYYSKNPWLSNLIYYNEKDKKYTEVPVTINEDIMKYLPSPTKEELQSAGGIKHYSCVFNPDKGYQDVDAAAVYDRDGNYIGCIITAYDYYSLINYHPLMISKDKSYEDYILFIVDDVSGKILYSTKPESINADLSKNSPYYDGQVLILSQDNKLGAYKYTSQAFYNYNRNLETEKITVWQDMPIYKRTYRVYLVDEINKPALVTENVYTPTTETTIDNVINLYVFAARSGKEAATARVSSGFYSTPIFIIDMEGNVLASSFNGQIGLNFLNNHGAYGTAYTKMMINAASLGGGFVYYTFPVEQTVTAKAAQFSNSYILPIDETCFIMGLFTSSTDVIAVDKQKKEDVAAVSREIIKRAAENGIEDVSEEITYTCNSDARYFVPNIKSKIDDLAILDFEGNVYASLKFPEKIGDVMTGYVDAYGGSTIRKAIMLAKSSGGFMVDLVKDDTKEGYNNLYVLSVEPISEDKFAVTSILIGTFEDLLEEHYED